MAKIIVSRDKNGDYSDKVIKAGKETYHADTLVKEDLIYLINRLKDDLSDRQEVLSKQIALFQERDDVRGVYERTEELKWLKKFCNTF